MLNRWNKLFAIAALALALPVVANAQTSRVEGMSLQGDYIKDYTSIYTYPSTVSHVGNLIYTEMGSGAAGSDRALGAVLGNLGEGRFGTWGIHLRQLTPSLTQGDRTSNPGIGTGGADLNNNGNHSFDLMWGKRVGGTSLGLRLNRSYNQTETALGPSQTTITLGDTSTFQRNVMGLAGGVGFEINPSTMFEVGLVYQTRTFERTTTPLAAATVPQPNMSEDSPGSYALSARLMWQWQPNVMVVPVAKVYSFDYSYKTASVTGAGAVNSTREASQKGWQLGVAGNWTLNQNDLFVLGLTAAHNTFEQDTNIFTAIAAAAPGGTAGYGKLEESISPQVFAALETHVNSWLTLRFGATQTAFGTLKLTPRAAVAPVTASQSDKRSFSNFSMNLGAGVKVGGLQFDAITAPNFYNNVGQITSQGWAQLTKVTATYAF